MADSDPIVQTIKIEVEGTDEATAAFKKVGDSGAQSFDELQKAATDAGKTINQSSQQIVDSSNKVGEGLDQVSQKSGVSNRQLKALGKVAKELGAGEMAGLAIGFAKIANVLGPIGVAVFAVAEAFSFIKGKMKEAEEAAKAITQEFANITRIAAEMKAENDASFWGTTAAGMKQAANDAGKLADQLKRIASGSKEAISPLTTQDALTKAFVKNLELAGIAVNDVMADTKKLGQASNQAALAAAKIYEKLSPIEKLEFEKVLKGLGFPEAVIKNIQKGSAALKALQDQAAKPFFTPEQQKSIDNLAGGWDAFVAASKRAWAMVAGDAEGGTRGLVQTIGASLATGFADAMAVVGQFERNVVAAISRIPGQISEFFSSLPGLIGRGIDAAKQLITDWVTTPVSNAWGWIAETFNSVVDTLKGTVDSAIQFITDWVTTPVSNAFQWIVDAIADAIAKAKAFFGIRGGVGGLARDAGIGDIGSNASGGLIGGRGSGTSDSNLAWVSRGEHIMPARAVSQPGVLALLEALRHSGGNLRGVLDGMGRFALGGLVAPTLSIPAFAGGGGMNHVTIQFPGLPEITGLRASSGVVDELRKAAAMAQVRSGGRKPSRYS
jgi:hypothetical protein